MSGGEVRLWCLELDGLGWLHLLHCSGLELLLCRLHLLLRGLEGQLWSLKPLLWRLSIQLISHLLWAADSALVSLIELLKLLSMVGRDLLTLLLL